MASIRVSLQDVVDGRAYLCIPPVGRILLAHMAGAPWLETSPDAYLHPLQVETLLRPEREKIIHGGSRLGKSVLGGIELMTESLLPFARFAVVAATFNHVGSEWRYLDTGLHRLFKGRLNAFTKLTYKNTAGMKLFDVQTVWDSIGRAISIDTAAGAQLLGHAFTRVVIGEGSHVPHEILERKIMRAADGALVRSPTSKGRTPERGYISIYTTPKGNEGCGAGEFDRLTKSTKGDLSRVEYGRVPFAESVWFRQASVLENPAYDRTVFEARKASLTPEAFAEQYLGSMTHTSRRVYAEFNERDHTVDLPTLSEIHAMRLGVGIDTGSRFGAVLCGIDSNTVKYVLGETYTERQHIDTSIADLKAMVEEVTGWPWTTAKERIELWAVDPASQHKVELMDGLDISLTHPFAPDVSMDSQGRLNLLPSIERVRRWFEAGDLLISRDCTTFLDQLRKYDWVSKRATGELTPRKARDHLLDALRFVLCPLDDLGPLKEPTPVESMADAWNAERHEAVFGDLQRMRDGTYDPYSFFPESF